MGDTLIEKDGPERKFYLIKRYGDFLRKAGYDPQTMSCQEIEAALKTTDNDVHKIVMFLESISSQASEIKELIKLDDISTGEIIERLDTIIHDVDAVRERYQVD